LEGKGLGAFSRVLKETVTRPVNEFRLGRAEVYRAGRSVGLDEKDISRIYSRNSLSGIKDFFSDHPFLLILTVFISILLFFAIAAWIQTYLNPPIYLRYGTVSTKDFKKSMFRH
jgi:hypothetical protein